ncbi:hypothetical protein CROQUDRAFT_62584 [Cronartium quercuum f. sp. fusiforme G11]|uniref:Protein kinase domain-containing protein n=1 Tax=Cronartium quercuum f. sp. fusiforme G11 TaxID=708437 RepID=A0A9P6NM78_9BASI|nr:hypothetical protein CROQUDRAFT_62584 [Cronartium quercuum f. sp. fusiforme G11]
MSTNDRYTRKSRYFSSAERTKAEKITNYDLLHRLGKGATAEVWLCVKRSTSEKFAMKIIPKKFLEQKNGKEMIENEIATMRRLRSHRFVVDLKTSFSDSNFTYLGLEYMTRGNLLQELYDKPFDNNLARFYVAQLTLALEFIHSEGVVHRDIKPENVLVGEDGYIKLADFGLADDLRWADHRTRGVIGTVFYMAPEILRHKAYSFPVDWYALGILMYELLTGRLPFIGKSRPQEDLSIAKDVVQNEVIYPDLIEPQARDLISKLTAKDPKVRPSKLSQVIHHPWFNDFDWIGVILTLAKAPYTRESLYQRKRKKTQFET